MRDLDGVMSAIHAYVMSDVDSSDARAVRYRIIEAIARLYGEAFTPATERFNALVAHVRSLPLDNFQIIPAKLANRERGWGDDGDRDSTQAARLAELVRRMDADTASWLEEFDTFDVDEGDAMYLMESAADIMRMWQAIRVITRSEGGK